MANEIALSVALAVSKGGASINSGTQSKSETLTGEDMIQVTQSVGFADAEALDLGELATCGCLLIRNMDATNFVEVALDEPMSNKICKIRAGHAALFQPTTTTLYVQADTAAVRILVCAVEV